MTPVSDGLRERILRLVETVAVLPSEGGLRLLHGVDVLRVRGPETALHAAVEHLTHGVPAGEIEALPPRSVLRLLVRRLTEAGWITDSDPDHGKGTELERQIGYLTLFGADAPHLQSRIAASRVAVLGVGGVGGVVAQHLVGAGTGALWLVDHDRVALHNLNRQFLSGRSDVGKFKTEVAGRSLHALAPGAELNLADCRISAPRDLDRLPDDLDLLVLAADTPADIATIVWDWARPRGIPMCSAAVGLGTGYWGPVFVPRLGHCMPCFEAGRLAGLSAEDVRAVRDDAPPTPYSFGPTNTVVSALLAHEVLRFLATGRCSVLNRRGHIRFSDGSTSFLDGAACTCAEGRQPSGSPGNMQAEAACAPSER